MMTSNPFLIFLKTRWGWGRFALITAAICLTALSVSKSPEFYFLLMRSANIPWLLLIFYLFMFGACIASFSRIFKFKVFFIGHLFLATGLLYLYINHISHAAPDAFYSLSFLKKTGRLSALHVLVGFMSFNLLIVAASPPTLKYKLTRLLALLIVLFEVGFFFIVLHNVSKLPTASLLVYGGGFLLAVWLVNLTAIALSILLVKEEYSFGGVLSALAIINIILAHQIDSGHMLLPRILFLLEPLLLSAGVFSFWFSCLHHRVAYDPLLKIYNRDYAHNILSGMSHVTLGRKFCIAMVDIDHFKRVNDTFGHAVGDMVLHGTAQCIRKFAMPHGITCRYGGEEIIVFFRNMGEDEAYAMCELIRKNVWKQKYDLPDRALSVSVSIGMAECDDPGIPLDRVLKSADEAVYKAKETGRNKVMIGRIRKRVNNPNRLTYRFVKATGADRRKESDG